MMLADWSKVCLPFWHAYLL